MTNRTHPLLLAAALCCTACATPEAPRPAALRTWGSLREALRDGQTQGRVTLSSVTAPGVYGVGAMAGLDGEITIVDGEPLVSRVRDGRVRTERSAAGEATLLVTAQVSAWRDVAVTADVDPSQLDEFLAQSAEAAGLDPDAPFPFVIDGELRHLRLHVIAGECPIRARMLGAEPKSPPFARHFDRVRGKLVGIHARNASGVLTHHGSAVHLHAVVGHHELTGHDEFTGHVESVGIAAGAVLRLQDLRARR
jgi:acetolactate decarboxylase